MKKTFIKILCVIFAVFLLITAVFVIGMGVMTVKGYGFTKGRCLITATGTYMLIDEDNSPIEISNRSDTDIFSDHFTMEFKSLTPRAREHITA